MTYCGERICRVCGYVSFDYFRDKSGYPTYIICDVCGNEAGKNDHTEEDIYYLRNLWLNSGAGIKYKNDTCWKLYINAPNILSNTKYKCVLENIIELIMPKSYDDSFTVIEQISSGGVISFDQAIVILVDLLNHVDFYMDAEDKVSYILKEIDHSDLQITPDQRAILERHASPSPPQNFSP